MPLSFAIGYGLTSVSIGGPHGAAPTPPTPIPEVTIELDTADRRLTLLVDAWPVGVSTYSVVWKRSDGVVEPTGEGLYYDIGDLPGNYSFTVDIEFSFTDPDKDPILASSHNSVDYYGFDLSLDRINVGYEAKLATSLPATL